MSEHENHEKWASSRELKVKVPVGVHVQLHSLKILTGKRISDVVTDALARYFETDTHGAWRQPPGLALPTSAAAHPRACACGACDDDA